MGMGKILPGDIRQAGWAFKQASVSGAGQGTQAASGDLEQTVPAQVFRVPVQTAVLAAVGCQRAPVDLQPLQQVGEVLGVVAAVGTVQPEPGNAQDSGGELGTGLGCRSA